MSTSRLRAGSCTVGAVRARQLQYRTTGTQAARAPGPLAQHGASATARRAGCRCRAMRVSWWAPAGRAICCVAAPPARRQRDKVADKATDGWTACRHFFVEKGFEAPY